MPEYLYHYTTIENLAYILKSKKLRFTRLDKVDDVTEGKSKDIENWGAFTFVSCWTDDASESIPLWKLYTQDMQGVRIKLATDMFKVFPILPAQFPSCFEFGSPFGNDVTSIGGMEISILSYLPYEKLHGPNYIIPPTCFDYKSWPTKIDYTDDHSKLDSSYKSHDSKTGYSVYRLKDIGRYKHSGWAFQREWRFILRFFNAESRDNMDVLTEDEYSKQMLVKTADFSVGMTFEHFDMELSDDAINAAEILIGPKANHANQIIVKSLVDSYCPNVSVKLSQFTGKIR